MTPVTLSQAEYEKLVGRAEKTDRLEKEVDLLKAMLRLMRLEKYGSKSEKLSDDQLELLELEPGVNAAEIENEIKVESNPVKVREHAGRNALPLHLERREEVLTSSERQCPCCGEARCVIGYEEREVLDLEPASYFVRVIKREKLACRKCPDGGVVTAAVSGPKIVEKGKLSDAVVVDVLIKKYASHLPIYRQQADLERDFGIELSRSTLNAAVLSAGELLMPMMGVLRADLLAGGYIQADETSVEVQGTPVQGRNHQAYEFQYSRPGGPVVFDFQMSRAREGPTRFLSGYGGILQCDGYAGYDKVGTPQIVRAGCMAHARRKYNEALKVDPQDRDAAEILAIIAKLYAIEKEARENGLSHEQRGALRQDKSMPVMRKLRSKIEQVALSALPDSNLGKACFYALNQWTRLIVYLENGRIEIDQNIAENSMRPIAVGRKNWLHLGSEEAGPKIAAIFSIFATCKRLQINLRDYLNDILPKLPDCLTSNLAELSPLRWRPS